jgi:hypothetical protein
MSNHVVLPAETNQERYKMTHNFNTDDTLRADDVESSSTVSNANEEADVAELLQRLESADGMAKGLESRLDDILGNLDNLLVTLESSEHGGSPSNPSKEH